MNLIEKLKIRTATIIIYVASIMMGMGSLGSCVMISTSEMASSTSSRVST